METRNSHGLDQFCATLLEREGQAVLDLGGVNQGTVSFITENHNRLTPEDFVVEFEECFGVGEDQEANQADPERIRAFGRAVFDFPNEHFDSILLWDALEVVSPELAPLVAHYARHRDLSPAEVERLKTLISELESDHE